MSNDDYHRRTAITRLAVSSADESLLRDTIEEWKQGCQIAVDKAWERYRSKSDVQQLAYDDVRKTRVSAASTPFSRATKLIKKPVEVAK